MSQAIFGILDSMSRNKFEVLKALLLNSKSSSLAHRLRYTNDRGFEILSKKFNIWMKPSQVASSGCSSCNKILRGVSLLYKETFPKEYTI